MSRPRQNPYLVFFYVFILSADFGGESVEWKYNNSSNMIYYMKGAESTVHFYWKLEALSNEKGRRICKNL